jgi:GxxExxY protein
MNVNANEITGKIIGLAIQVHRNLGPGLLESAYETCLAYELNQAGFSVERQKGLPLRYKNVRLDCGYRLDLLINKQVIVEIKAIDAILPIHVAQLLSYLKMTDLHVGLLINFNVYALKSGIRRVVNNFQETPRSQR